MFVKNGDDPKSKILSVVDAEEDSKLNEEMKLAINKMKDKLNAEALIASKTEKN